MAVIMAISPSLVIGRQYSPSRGGSANLNAPPWKDPFPPPCFPQTSRKVAWTESAAENRLTWFFLAESGRGISSSVSLFSEK
jgi:hypothetical protein